METLHATYTPDDTTQYYTSAAMSHDSGVPDNNASHPDQKPQDFNDIWTCSECGAENLDWIDLCPMCNKGTRSVLLGYNSATPTAQPFGYAMYAPGTSRTLGFASLDDYTEYAGVTGSCVLYSFERH
ncbi:hypothetical protein NX059_004493 [Plenodomus lindquistii]|nr:hypothetical protein NX059_004493 [Plenodomus lindquistii]